MRMMMIYIAATRTGNRGREVKPMSCPVVGTNFTLRTLHIKNTSHNCREERISYIGFCRPVAVANQARNRKLQCCTVQIHVSTMRPERRLFPIVCLAVQFRRLRVVRTVW